jgi:hypothetical protein
MPGDIKVATSQDPTLQRIESLMHRRTESDRRMSYAWMIVPLLPLAAAVVIGALLVGILVSLIPNISNLSHPTTAQSTIAPIVGGILALYGLAIIVLFITLFFGALSFYYLIDRRNRHLARQQLLFSTLHRYLASKAPTSESIARLTYLSEDSTYEERPRPAGLWALLFLFVTPIVGLITSYNLTQDMRKHDDFQSNYQTALASSLVEAGFQQPNFQAYKSRSRDPVLFLVLSAITGGVFWIYWYYTLLKDYNEHFADQARFEDQILKEIAPPQIDKNCGTCGGKVPANAKFCPNCGSKQES